MAVRRSLLSGRSQLRLAELHRAVATSLQTLNQHHSLLVGALMSCDAATQQAMRDEHRRHVAVAIDALAKLGIFLDHCRIDLDEAADDPSANGAPAIS
ncbi:hypothetical protein HNQ60_000091 [Povalibacter uvarum]|uniref:Uncharacterized protein n=1 Tax=Povalibacter uvarum TaxID=732238 RepID=A0A841HGN5_9GAMM|nr:hypothetical protein [Povalibacter uvarum]MBB6091245.1 hypothetical protein [Povalibacter uvarum]